MFSQQQNESLKHYLERTGTTKEEFKREEKKHALYEALKNAKRHPGLDQEEITEVMVDALGIDAKYLVGPLKVELRKQGYMEKL